MTTFADKTETRDATPVIAPNATYEGVTQEITGIVLRRGTALGWYLMLAISLFFVSMLTAAIAWLFMEGIGIWGVNIPVAWGFAIANFVWWIGIGHAGTFISAFLFCSARSGEPASTALPKP